MLRSLAILAALVLASFQSPAQAQVLLKRKVNENTIATREVSTFITQTLTINGMEIKTEVDAGVTTSATAGRRDADGRIAQKVKFEAIRSNITAAGGASLNFDSSINLAKTDSPQLQVVLDALKTLAGASFMMIVDADNQLVAIEGNEEIIKNAPDSAAAVIKGQLASERIKQEHQQVVARYPNKPVKPGDTWENVEAVDLGSGQVMKMLRQYEYLGTEQRGGRTLDKLSAPDKKVVSFEIDERNPLPIKITKNELAVADSKATILFDRELGSEVEISRLMHIKGKLTLNINGADLPTEVDLKIETTDRLKP